jgi:hypothetical protein
MSPDERFALVLGRAVVSIWGGLSKDVQQQLFEGAVISGHRSERDESLREELAAFLHERHPRTAD